MTVWRVCHISKLCQVEQFLHDCVKSRISSPFEESSQAPHASIDTMYHFIQNIHRIRILPHDCTVMYIHVYRLFSHDVTAAILVKELSCWYSKSILWELFSYVHVQTLSFAAGHASEIALKYLVLCSCSFYDEPTLISGLAGKQVIQIACGSAHSAAVTSEGELYTWGRGSYGRLGHGKNSD